MPSMSDALESDLDVADMMADYPAICWTSGIRRLLAIVAVIGTIQFMQLISNSGMKYPIWQPDHQLFGSEFD